MIYFLGISLCLYICCSITYTWGRLRGRKDVLDYFESQLKFAKALADSKKNQEKSNDSQQSN